jgi:PAS domain S-box-containing protein
VPDTQERYFRAVEGINDGLWDWNIITGEDYLSPRWKELLGFSDDELTNHENSFFALLHPDDMLHVQEAIKAHLNERIPYDMEMRLRTKSGEYRWFRSRGKAEYDKTGHPWRMTGVTSDIHETKTAREQLQQANEELQRARDLLEKRVEERTTELRRVTERLLLAAKAGHVGIWDWDVTRDILVWDDAMYRLYGIRPEQFTGAYEAWQTGVHPEDRERGNQEIQMALQGQREFDTEFRVLWPGGEVRYIKAYGLVQRDEAGRAIRLLGTNWDITERKQAEQILQQARRDLEQRVAERTAALQESEERYRRIVETANEGIWVVDANGHVSFANPKIAAMLGYTVEEMLGRPLTDFMDQEGYALFLNRESHQAVQEDFQLLCKDGTCLWGNISSSMVRDSDGVYLGILAMVTDITERKQVEERTRQWNATLEKRVKERTAELEAAYKELEAFSYSVSHDLRAPLRAIDGFSRIVQEDFGKDIPPQAQEYLNDVRDNVKKMGCLVSDLLAFSRLGRQSIRKQQIDTKTLVMQCIQDLQTTYEGRTVHFQVATLPPCLADLGLLRQVWLNLLENALKYSRTREKAVIEIGYQTGNQDITYYIRDNGVGFDMRYADKLFGVFQRLHRAEDYEGTGVGLAIVQRIVHRHQGWIWAEAEPDKGATFFFLLPTTEARSDE